MTKSLIALAHLACSVVFCLVGWLDPWFERSSRWASATWRRAVDAWDFACLKVEASLKSVLDLFGPSGLFAMRLLRASNLVMTHVRAWRQGGTSEHYRAPGSWVSCAST